MQIAINEIFGPTIQGEGFNMGKPCLFLRLMGCNLSCRFCDTPYTWDAKRFDLRSETTMMSVSDIKQALHELSNGVRHVVISGGEPVLQQTKLSLLTQSLHVDGWYTEIETAGTIAPQSFDMVKHWNVSPKMSNSGNAESKRLNGDALQELNNADSVCFKFVVEDLEDFEEIDSVVLQYSLSPIYIMPEGTDAQTILNTSRNIAEATIERGYTLTTRLHTLMYGNQRGI